MSKLAAAHVDYHYLSPVITNLPVSTAEITPDNQIRHKTIQSKAERAARERELLRKALAAPAIIAELRALRQVLAARQLMGK